MSAITSVSRETPQPRTHPSVSRETATESSPGVLARAVLLPIRAYRRFLSPALSPRCRYYPSCSAYAEQSIRELGAVRGVILAAWRVLRCNPLSKGGVDLVCERRLFRSDDPSHECSAEADLA